MNVSIHHTEALIAIGGNLGEREVILRSAVCEISRFTESRCTTSPLYETVALVAPGKYDPAAPRYLNGVVRVPVIAPVCPTELLRTLLAIEKAHGRSRDSTQRWAPRTLDLDLLAVGDHVLVSDELVLPHPELHKRSFVLAPLCDICPEWQHPVLHLTAKDMLSHLPSEPYPPIRTTFTLDEQSETVLCGSARSDERKE